MVYGIWYASRYDMAWHDIWYDVLHDIWYDIDDMVYGMI